MRENKSAGNIQNQLFCSRSNFKIKPIVLFYIENNCFIKRVQSCYLLSPELKKNIFLLCKFFYISNKNLITQTQKFIAFRGNHSFWWKLFLLVEIILLVEAIPFNKGCSFLWKPFLVAEADSRSESYVF